MRAPAGIELLSEGSWNPGSVSGEWSPGGCGCGSGSGELCSCGGSCGCEGEGGGSCGGGNPSGEVPLLPDYDGEIWASPPSVVDRDAYPVVTEWIGGSVGEPSTGKGGHRQSDETPAQPEWPPLATFASDPWWVPEGWFWGIPVCPCDLDTLKGMGDKGVNLKQDGASTVGQFHSPAKECWRIWFSGDVAGNQCCFDADDKLITHGSGAGTPDMYNPNFIALHLFADVIPFEFLGWEEYHRRGWAPISEDCPKNSGAFGHPTGTFPGRPPSAPNPPRPVPPPSPDEVWRAIVRQCESACMAEVIREFEGPSESAKRYFDECVEDCLDFWSNV